MAPLDAIKKILKKNGSLRNKCERLVDYANEQGGKDNITVTLVDILSSDDPQNFEMKVAE